MKMSLENLITGKQDRPLRISLYGVDGIGKSTFAAGSPAPIFIAAEDGTAHLDVARFPKPETWNDVMECIGVLYEGDHEFKTVVLDTADWAEKLAAQQVCQEQNVTSLEEIPYGKWKRFLTDTFAQCLRGFDALYLKGMNVIIISHSEIKSYNDPEHESYDRHQIKLHDAISSMIREWCDCNLFANYDTTIKKMGKGFNEQSKGVSYGKRLLFTERSAAFDAKNRYNLQTKLPLDWNAFWTAFEQATKPQTKAA